MRSIGYAWVCLVAVGLLRSCTSSPPGTQEVLYFAEGNRLHRLDLGSIAELPLMEDLPIDNANSGELGRDVNGQICRLSAGGVFVMGEDTGQPNTPAGWGVFDHDGAQIGKLTSTYFSERPEPFGCAVDPEGRLFTTELGDPVAESNGQLILWFPPFDRFPGPEGAYPDTDAVSGNFCKLAIDIGTAASVAIDEEGRVLVASARSGVLRFSPPFPTAPTAAGGCGSVDALGSPMADQVTVEEFRDDPSQLFSPTGIARAPNGNWYISSVFDGIIAEYDAEGRLVRRVLDPVASQGLPRPSGHPQAIAVARDGTIYYSDLQLSGELPDVGPGPNGKVRRITFDPQGEPNSPEIIREGLSFPDGLAIFEDDSRRTQAPAPGEWLSYAGGRHRMFFNPEEHRVTADNVSQLEVLWTFQTNAIVTASPSVARLYIPGEGLVLVAFVQAWDANLYALRVRDGSELWRFRGAEQPGATFPNAGSVHIERIEGEARLFYGAGQTLYCLNAVTGEEIWHFEAGTGCQQEGDCGFDAERNEIESSPIVTDGKVFFGMDVNDVGNGKGGFFALDAMDGRLRWFFDLETGSTCIPSPDDDIRRYDGYHAEAELGLPPGFLETRPGCNVDRTGNGCGNVWSSAAIDASRGLLFFASSNCDTDDDPNTPEPPPPMPPYDEAVIALTFEGRPAWRWRPREVDNDDLAFGAAPNLFQIVLNGQRRDVLGVGNKDGTYYVLDREGVNRESGVRWNDSDPSTLPYWSTKVVPGGFFGGLIATASADSEARRIYFSTAPGFDPLDPQQPTVHSLDMDTGDVIWQNSSEQGADASFGPTSAIPGVVFVGSVVERAIRVYDAVTGAKLNSVPIAASVVDSVASAPAIVEGVVLVGAGIGARSNDAEDFSDITSRMPQNITALCVPGTPYCREP